MTAIDERVVIFGASGHAKVVIDVLEKQGRARVEFLADDNPALHGRDFYGYRIVGGRSELQARCSGASDLVCIVTIGDNLARAEVADWLKACGLGLAGAAVHPSAQLARGVSVAAGSVLMAGGVVNSDTVIGRNVIINTGATIDHDCVIGDAVHVAPGATLCGSVSVGDFTLIGAGAVVHPNVRIGRNVIVGAGATVLENVPDGATVVGTPARRRGL